MGSGLYSDDFAMDLRGTISAVARLPFDGDKLVDVTWDGKKVMMFTQDLRSRADAIAEASAD